MAKKGLLDAVADAMNKAKWARIDLDNLDRRAYKMQGNSKAWGRNADKMNERARALEAKALWNEYELARLKQEGIDRVNESNMAFNKRLEDFKDRSRSIIEGGDIYDPATHYEPTIDEINKLNVRDTEFNPAVYNASEGPASRRMREVERFVDVNELPVYPGDYGAYNRWEAILRNQRTGNRYRK